MRLFSVQGHVLHWKNQRADRANHQTGGIPLSDYAGALRQTNRRRRPHPIMTPAESAAQLSAAIAAKRFLGVTAQGL